MNDVVIRRYDMPPFEPAPVPIVAEQPAWVSPLLFRTAMAVVAIFVVLLLATPFLDLAGHELWMRVGRLLAHDSLVRQTAVVSCVGIYAVALICFRRN